VIRHTARLMNLRFVGSSEEIAVRRTWAALLLWMSFATTSFAHYNMLIPDKAWANKGDKVTFTYQFGHPFEHDLFDAPKPVALVVLTPKGKRDILDIDKLLTPIKTDGADGKKVAAWQFTFTPPERGDYTFVLKTAKIKHEEDKFVEDVVRVVLHVQTQNGWHKPEQAFPKDLDIVPFTRPYGLLPGMVFRGQYVGPAVASALVEIEKYNEKPMKNLPAEEFITFSAKTDGQGFFVTTLPEPGWWGITAVSPFARSKGPDEHTLRRATMWIHVDEKK